MSFLLSIFVGKYAKIFWPIMVILAAYLYVKGLNDDIKDLKADKRALQQELVIRKQEYETNLGTMQTAIDDQNGLIAHLNKQNEKAEQEAVVKIEAARIKNEALSSKLAEQIQLINNIETPQTCQAAIDLMVDVAIQHPWPAARE